MDGILPVPFTAASPAGKIIGAKKEGEDLRVREPFGGGSRQPKLFTIKNTQSPPGPNYVYRRASADARFWESLCFSFCHDAQEKNAFWAQPNPRRNSWYKDPRSAQCDAPPFHPAEPAVTGLSQAAGEPAAGSLALLPTLVLFIPRKNPPLCNFQGSSI